jgi:hypothetical protein
MNDEVKEKKKKKAKNTKKKINEKIDTTVMDKEIEQFIEDLKIHTRPANRIRKIKPHLSKEWINSFNK